MLENQSQQADLNPEVDGRVISVLSHAQQEAMESLTELANGIVRGFADYNREVFRFVSERISDDLATGSELTKCQSVAEVMSLQNAFIDRAIRDYTQEAERLTTLGAKLLTEDLDTVNRHMKAITDEAVQLEEELANEEKLQT